MIPNPRDTIHLGVEIELLLSGRNVAVSSWWEVAEDISGLMCQAGIDTEVADKIEELPIRWAVTTDASLSDSRYKDDPMFIRPDEKGFELVSKCFPEPSAWEAEIQRVFKVLEDSGYKIRVNKSCGLHVHASHGSDMSWTFGTARSLSALFLEDEEELDKVSGGLLRQLGDYSKTNRESQKLLPYKDDTPAAIRTVRESPGYTQLVGTMSTEADGRVTRLWKLNLTNLTKNPKSEHPSIEFRQHEGVCLGGAVIGWVEEVIKLIRRATGEGYHDVVSLDEQGAEDKPRAAVETASVANIAMDEMAGGGFSDTDGEEAEEAEGVVAEAAEGDAPKTSEGEAAEATEGEAAKKAEGDAVKESESEGEVAEGEEAEEKNEGEEDQAGENEVEEKWARSLAESEDLVMNLMG